MGYNFRLVQQTASGGESQVRGDVKLPFQYKHVYIAHKMCPIRAKYLPNAKKRSKNAKIKLTPLGAKLIFFEKVPS